MACPRCGGRLERYELSDHVEASCADCGYVGVPVDHGSERPRGESWATAIERVEEQFDDATATDVGPAPPPVPDEGGDSPQPSTVRTVTETAPVGGVERADDGSPPSDGDAPETAGPHEADGEGADSEGDGGG